jgi:hypothetical protein
MDSDGCTLVQIKFYGNNQGADVARAPTDFYQCHDFGFHGLRLVTTWMMLSEMSRQISKST